MDLFEYQAKGLFKAHGVPTGPIGEGLRAFVPDPHRNQSVLVHDGVEWVDDSKATNPHAAGASLAAYPRIVWIAGGQLKGVRIDELVAQVADRLAGVVLLGQDRADVAAALARHATDVPVIMVESTDDGAMTEVVGAAAGLARPGDTVLLASVTAPGSLADGAAAPSPPPPGPSPAGRNDQRPAAGRGRRRTRRYRPPGSTRRPAAAHARPRHARPGRARRRAAASTRTWTS